MLNQFWGYLYIDGSMLDFSWYHFATQFYTVHRLAYCKYLVVVDDAHLLLKEGDERKEFLKSLIINSKYLILLGSQAPPRT